MKKLSTLLVLLLLFTVNFSQSGKIDVNNINTIINPSNVMFQTLVPDTNLYFEAEKGNKTSTIYASTILMGGIRNSDSALCGSHQSYKGGSSPIPNSFSTGPLSCTPGSGTGGKKDFGAATINAGQKLAWNKVFCTNKSQIKLFIDWYLCSKDPFCDTSISFPGYTIPNSILNWPAHGNASLFQDKNLAPFVDIDSDGIYNPSNGDHPCIKGDQYCWYIINDRGVDTNRIEMGIEIQVEVYSYKKDSLNPINNTIFVGKKIINRSTSTYNDFVVSQFTDFDIGCGTDDYVGTMSSLNSYYGYNGDSFDDNCYIGFFPYGNTPPAQGVTFLNKSLSSSMYTDRYGVFQDPSNMDEAYQIMNGKWKDSTHLQYGGNGYPSPIGTSTSGINTNFVYPYSTSTGSIPWTEVTESNGAGDRRIYGSIGPVTLTPGDVYNVDLAYVFSRSDSGHLKSVDKLYRDIQIVQAFYNDSIPVTCQAFVLSIPEENLISAKVYPNPSTDFFTIESEGKSLKMDITAIDGKLISSGLQLNQSARIDATTWADGLYLVKVYDEKGNFKVLRIVKN